MVKFMALNLESPRERFLRACYCQAVDRPPVWLMRQAGRALPEYRALKRKHSFLQLVQTPELAAEVTLQPIRRFGFDAAILFSDILVVPEALGQPYRFRETGGVEMDFALRSSRDLERLQWEGMTNRLQYVAQALRLIKSQLGNQTALLGFGASPWTLANFMVEGGSAAAFTRARQWWREDGLAFDQFLEKLAAVLIEYFEMQIEAGVDAVQIFDSLGGILDDTEFEPASARWIKSIVRALANKVPVIVFSKGPRANWNALVDTGARVLSFDDSVRLRDARSWVPESVCIQGNLEPSILLTTPETVAHAATEILVQMQGRKGYIFNLAHGLPPESPIENIDKLVDTIKNFAWAN